MTHYLFRNEKGLFGQLKPKVLMTAPGVKNLQDWINQPPSNPNQPKPSLRNLKEQEKEVLQKFLGVLTQFEIELCWVYPLTVNDQIYQSSPGTPVMGYGQVLGYSWIDKEGGFSSQRKESNFVHSQKTMEEDWDTLLQWEIPDQVKALTKECGVTFFDYKKKDIKNLINTFKKCSFDIINPAEDLSIGKAYAVYISPSGYLTHNGVSPSISAARPFESEEAARRTIRSQKLRDTVVVELALELKAIMEEVKGPSECTSSIRDALALSEQRSLKKVLTDVDIENQLEEFRKMKLAHPEWLEENKSIPIKGPKSRL